MIRIPLALIALNGELLTDESAATLAGILELSLITVGQCSFSDSATSHLRHAKPNATIFIGDRNGNAK